MQKSKLLYLTNGAHFLGYYCILELQCLHMGGRCNKKHILKVKDPRNTFVSLDPKFENSISFFLLPEMPLIKGFLLILSVP